MRISQLSARAGLPVATVKFYLRAGLLHSGRATSATQSLYDDSHLKRLRLIRALLEVGRLPLADIQRVLDAAANTEDQPEQHRHTVREALAAPTPQGSDLRAAHFLAERLGWSVPRDSPHLATLERTLRTIRSVGLDEDAVLASYAVAAELVARADADGQVGMAPESVVAATVLNEALLVALHRLAAEHVDADRRSDAQAVPRPRSHESRDREQISS